MSSNKKVIFIGNRSSVFNMCAMETSWEIKLVLAVEGSYLVEALKDTKKIPHRQFQFRDKEKICQILESEDYDVLVSNGCPFILPIERFNGESRLFLNIHPSLLPELRGPHPVNGAILKGHKKFGATVHHMVDNVDEGHIIYQLAEELTPQLSVSEIYKRSFELEALAFQRAINLLKDNNYNYPGYAQVGQGSFYKRKITDMTLDFVNETVEQILLKVRAFGIKSLGCETVLSSGRYRIFAARSGEKIAPLGKAGQELQLNHKNVQALDGWVELMDYIQL